MRTGPPAPTPPDGQSTIHDLGVGNFLITAIGSAPHGPLNEPDRARPQADGLSRLDS